MLKSILSLKRTTFPILVGLFPRSELSCVAMKKNYTSQIECGLIKRITPPNSKTNKWTKPILTKWFPMYKSLTKTKQYLRPKSENLRWQMPTIYKALLEGRLFLPLAASVAVIISKNWIRPYILPAQWKSAREGIWILVVAGMKLSPCLTDKSQSSIKLEVRECFITRAINQKILVKHQPHATNNARLSLKTMMLDTITAKAQELFRPQKWTKNLPLGQQLLTLKWQQ